MDSTHGAGCFILAMTLAAVLSVPIISGIVLFEHANAFAVVIYSITLVVSYKLLKSPYMKLLARMGYLNDEGNAKHGEALSLLTFVMYTVPAYEFVVFLGLLGLFKLIR